MKKLDKLFSSAVIFMMIAIIFLITFWSIYPYNPLVLTNITLNKTEISRGEHLIVSADYCKNTQKPAELFITFIDGIVYSPQPQIIDLESGCHHTNMSIYIPKALPIGSYTLEGVFRYKVNPIRTIDINDLTGRFNIIK